MRQDDVDSIMQVMDRAFDPAFGEAWTRAQLTGGLIMPGTFYTIIDDTGVVGGGGATAGFTLVRTVLDEAELMLIAIAPEWRGQGLGRSLLADLLNQAVRSGTRRLHLEMRADNPARALYESMGFTAVGQRRNYYRGRDGITRDAVTFAIEPVSGDHYY